MSYSYSFNPKVANPHLSNKIPQMESGGFQKPFFFGGSQIPTDLFLSKSQYSGSSGTGLHQGNISKSHIGDLDFTTKKGDMIYHRKNHNIKIPHSLPFMK